MVSSRPMLAQVGNHRLSRGRTDEQASAGTFRWTGRTWCRVRERLQNTLPDPRLWPAADPRDCEVAKSPCTRRTERRAAHTCARTGPCTTESDSTRTKNAIKAEGARQ